MCWKLDHKACLQPNPHRRPRTTDNTNAHTRTAPASRCPAPPPRPPPAAPGAAQAGCRRLAVGPATTSSNRSSTTRPSTMRTRRRWCAPAASAFRPTCRPSSCSRRCRTLARLRPASYMRLLYGEAPSSWTRSGRTRRCGTPLASCGWALRGPGAKCTGHATCAAIHKVNVRLCVNYGGFARFWSIFQAQRLRYCSLYVPGQHTQRTASLTVPTRLLQ